MVNKLRSIGYAADLRVAGDLPARCENDTAEPECGAQRVGHRQAEANGRGRVPGEGDRDTHDAVMAAMAFIELRRLRGEV